jgi:hypothetical protein
MAQTVNVTGRRLTSARTTFTIAGFARAKEFGDYGNCLTSQDGFHIWPLGEKEGERAHKSAEEPAPVEAVATGVLPGSTTPTTACVCLRSINARLTSSHLNQRRSPREICLRRRCRERIRRKVRASRRFFFRSSQSPIGDLREPQAGDCKSSSRSGQICLPSQ